MPTNIFEQATRRKLRFDTPKGYLPVEDLWDLPLTSARGPSLDALAIELDKELKTTTTISFVNTATNANTELQLKFEVVKYILDTKMAENAAARDANKKAERAEKLKELIEKKQDEATSAKTVEELQAELAALNA